jgi:nucleotide-binding universal stress UspA family protein
MLPVFGADDAKLILDFVCNYHWPPHAQFKVIHVLGGSDTDTSFAISENDAKELVTRVANRLETFVPDTQVGSEVVYGAAIYEILTAASTWKSDMIVMGYRSRLTVESSMMASVSKAVSVQAPCSVVIIRPPELPAAASEKDVTLCADAV